MVKMPILEEGSGSPQGPQLDLHAGCEGSRLRTQTLFNVPLLVPISCNTHNTLEQDY